MFALLASKYFQAILVLVALLIIYIGGDISARLADKKGYFGSKYFFLGFFLSILGIIYVAGLPESDEHLKRRISYLSEAPKVAEVVEQPQIAEINQVNKDIAKRFVRLRL